MGRKYNTKLNENGFASIVIALIFIIVLALLTVGFAQLARREQQTALDKQLATQANYAAESGINAAYRDILDGKITASTTNVNSQQCVPPLTSDPTAATYSHDLDTSNGVSYSCLLINLQTPNLVSNNLTPGTGKHMNFGTQDPLSNLTIYWGSASGHNNPSTWPDISNTKFPTLNSWGASGYPPVVEFSITPVSNLSAQSNPTQYLINNTTNVYLYPSSSGNSTCDTSNCTQGQILSGDCDPTATRPSNEPDATNFPCSATITGLGGQGYVVHYIDFYDTSNIWIDGQVNSGGNLVPAQFTGEPMIDVTGQDRNVLKRLQARLFINGGSNGTPNDNAVLPNYAVEAQNLCKRIQAAPSTPDFRQGSTYDSLDPSCSLSN